MTITYIPIIKIGIVVFEQNGFLDFTYPLHNSSKNEISRLFFGGSLCATWISIHGVNMNLIRAGATFACLYPPRPFISCICFKFNILVSTSQLFYFSVSKEVNASFLPLIWDIWGNCLFAELVSIANALKPKNDYWRSICERLAVSIIYPFI